MLTLLAVGVAHTPTTHVVPYWTDDAGYCKKIPGYDEGVHRPHGLDRVHAAVGDKISFTYAKNHDIWSHPTLDALESCDYSEAVRVAGPMDGGGCDDEADLACMAAATPFLLNVSEAGMKFLSCRVGAHCANGQRVVIEMHEEARAPPLEVLVPLWADNAGYCKAIPACVQDEQTCGADWSIDQHHGTHGVRPHGIAREGGGLEPITIAHGQTLVFRYSTHHDIWMHASAESLAACDYTGAAMLADRQDGGGCEDDTDLMCQERSVGFRLTPTEQQVGTKLYLSCSVGDHCQNGQTLVVTIVDGPGPSASDEAGSAPAAADSGAEVTAIFVVGLLLGTLFATGISCGYFKVFKSKVGSGLPEVAMTRRGGSDDPAHVSNAA